MTLNHLCGFFEFNTVNFLDDMPLFQCMNKEYESHGYTINEIFGLVSFILKYSDCHILWNCSYCPVIAATAPDNCIILAMEKLKSF